MGAVALAADGGREWYELWSGGLLMLVFFRVSAYMTDMRMLETRGPEYKTVMREVSGLVPMPPRLCMLSESAPLF
jgi:protein-S-isoprenylcysteine O-methyltransferase Ste14